jgi:hypothetical protein
MQAAGFVFDAAVVTGRSTRVEEVFLRTALFGMVFDGIDTAIWRRFKPDDLDLLDPFKSWIENEQLECPMSFSLEQRLTSTFHLRTYFRTRSGGHGLCYPSCEVGDQVWIVHGSTVPFVLRPIHMNEDIEENI